MTFKGGYAGSVLYVNLSTRKVVKKQLNKKLARDFVGGRGFTSKIQYDMITPDIEPLSPRNLLIFATGPLTGCALSSGRFVVGGRSPLTGILGDSSCGGNWGPELKFAGYDMIVFSGSAKKPVYLWVNNENVEIRDAGHLWGKGTWETEGLLKEELRDEELHVASIGQAGENLVKFANIMSDLDHAAGRTGMGAIMGSKNLKAVAVRGTRGIKIADSKNFMKAIDELMLILNEDPVSSIMSPKFGTTRYLSYERAHARLGGLACFNWKTGVFEGSENICAEVLREKYVTKALGCFGCTLRCDRYTEIKEGPYKGTSHGGPEYFALISFGTKCGNDNLASIIKANEISNIYGIDIASAGGIIGFAMECYEKGILTKDDTDGLDLEWGNYESILKLLRKIVFREGFGNLLAEGVRNAAEKIGKNAERYAMHVKGMDMVSGDPRHRKAYNLRYAISSRGADHLRLQAILDQATLDELPYDETGRLLKWWEDVFTMIEAMGLCKFCYATDSSSRDIVKKKSLEVLPKLYSSATGIKASGMDILRSGERINNIEKVFNMRLGMTRKDDTLPTRIFEEPLPEGVHKGSVFERERFDSILSEYYKARGWNSETGTPTMEKLDKLKLKGVAHSI